jgi:hypothetical protein
MHSCQTVTTWWKGVPSPGPFDFPVKILSWRTHRSLGHGAAWSPTTRSKKPGMQQHAGMEVPNDGISHPGGASAVHLRMPRSRTLAAVSNARSRGAGDRFCGAQIWSEPLALFCCARCPSRQTIPDSAPLTPSRQTAIALRH